MMATLGLPTDRAPPQVAPLATRAHRWKLRSCFNAHMRAPGWTRSDDRVRVRSNVKPLCSTHGDADMPTPRSPLVAARYRAAAACLGGAMAMLGSGALAPPAAAFFDAPAPKID